MDFAALCEPLRSLRFPLSLETAKGAEVRKINQEPKHQAKSKKTAQSFTIHHPSPILHY